MADVIKTIGAAGSGADYANYQTWFAARTGGAGDRYIGEIITTTGGLSTGLATSGNYAMEIVLRAAAGLEFDPTDPTKPHAIISASSSGGINIPSTGAAQLTIENIEVRSTNASPTTGLINTGSAVADVTIRGCWLRGGRHGAQNAVSGSTLLIENSIIEGAYRAGILASFSGVTARNSVIVGCNIEAGTTATYCGMRKDVAGTVIENVVAFGNATVDFFGATTNATVSYMASGDTSASGTGALTGVTSAAFTDYANDIFTAATGGVLDGTGPSGNDRGIVTTSNPTILLINPAANVFLARDKDTNTGNISINGTCTDLTAGATIEARFNGGSWQVIDAAPTGTFSGTLTGAAVGVGAVEVRVSNFVTATDSHAGIAVGAKFLFWGQSNFSGRANNAQTYTGPAGWWRKRAVESNTQVVATADPFDTYTVNGSIFPLLATQLTAALECPVLFIGVAAGGTSLAQWQPGQSLNNRMLTFYAAESPTGHVEAVATWIGEGDSVLETAEADFKSRYNVVIDQLKALTGANSMLVAISGENTTPYANVRQWIKDIAATSANVSDIVPEIWPLYQKIHYETDTETALAADAVGDGLINSFYNVGYSVIGVSALELGGTGLSVQGYVVAGQSALELGGAGTGWQTPYATGVSAVVFGGVGIVTSDNTYSVSGTSAVVLGATGAAWQTPYAAGTSAASFSGVGVVSLADVYEATGVSALVISGTGNIWQTPYASGASALSLSGAGSAWQTPYATGISTLDLSGVGRAVRGDNQRFGVVRLQPVAVSTVLRYNVALT